MDETPETSLRTTTSSTFDWHKVDLLDRTLSRVLAQHRAEKVPSETLSNLTTLVITLLSALLTYFYYNIAVKYWQKEFTLPIHIVIGVIVFILCLTFITLLANLVISNIQRSRNTFYLSQTKLRKGLKRLFEVDINYIPYCYMLLAELDESENLNPEMKEYLLYILSERVADLDKSYSTLLTNIESMYRKKLIEPALFNKIMQMVTDLNKRTCDAISRQHKAEDEYFKTKCDNFQAWVSSHQAG